MLEILLYAIFHTLRLFLLPKARCPLSYCPFPVDTLKFRGLLSTQQRTDAYTILCRYLLGGFIAVLALRVSPISHLAGALPIWLGFRAIAFQRLRR